MKKLFCLLAALLCLPTLLSAQLNGTGAYSFASFDTPGFDSVNLGNLNVRFSIPIVSRTGRSTPFVYALQYEGLLWQAVDSGNGKTWVPDPSWGLNGVLNGISFAGYLTHGTVSRACPRPAGWSHNVPSATDYRNYVYHDAFGAAHPFLFEIEGACPISDDPHNDDQITGDGSTNDNSGYKLNTSNPNQVISRSGMVINPALSSSGQDAANITDRNGNQISSTGSGSFTDTLGSTALTISGSSPRTFTYPVARQPNNASTASTTMTYRTYNVRTNFACPDIGEYGSNSVSLPDRITLADGSFYAFSYEPTYGSNDGAVTGRLASVTLPTGGAISYSYTAGCSGAGMNPDGTVGSLTRTTSDGSRSYIRAGINSNATSTTLQDEKSNQTYLAFTIDSATGRFFETHRQTYQGSTSGSQLLDQYTCYNGATANCDGQGITLPISEADVTSSYNGGSQVITKNAYDPNGTLLTESGMYNGGTRLTRSQYEYNALGELTRLTRRDPNDGAYFFAYYNYDEGTPITTSNLPQHTGATGARGNLTSTHTSAGDVYLNTATTYYDTGMPSVQTAEDGAQTTFSYDATQGFATTTTLPTPSSGVSLSTTAQYDAASAMPLSSTGLNGDSTTVNHYDSLLRPIDVSLPSGSAVTVENFSPIHSMVHQTLDAGRQGIRETLLDGYGRVSRVGLYNGQSSNSWNQVDYCYDASGLLAFQSVAYQSTGEKDGNGNDTPKHCSGSGIAYSYDALGRVTSVATDDGTATTEYSNRAVRTTDVNSVQKITQYDLIGRVSGVCEISSSSLVGQSPTNCSMDIGGTGYVTSYGHSTGMNNTTITQGSQTRTIETDPAGRVRTTVEPERGTTTYSYAYNSVGLQVKRNRPAADQSNPNSLTETATQYDLLGRIVSVSYNDGFSTNKNFYFDTAPSNLGWTGTPSNVRGRLAVTTTGNTRAQLSYDTAGNVTTMWQCGPSICGTGNQEGRPALEFRYDLSGALKSYFDGVSGTIAYTRSPSGEITSVANQNYTDQYNTPNLVSNVTNGPFGATNWMLGNGDSAVQTYDSMGRIYGGWLCSGNGGLGSGAYCNGNTQMYGFIANHKGQRVTGICDTVMGQCQNPGYDAFNRLTSVNGPSSFTYSYDRWGNRTQQTGSPSVSYNFDAATNHNTSFGYDAAGNQTNDASHSYFYDAEGKVLSVDQNGSTAQYTYDAFDNRVRVQTASLTHEYLFDPFGRRISSWVMNGSAVGGGNEGRIYWDRGLLANRSWNGSTYFHHSNWLGTERLRTDYQGQTANAQRSQAFGDGFSQDSGDNQGAAQDNTQFTGQERDAETDTTHFQYRQYSSAAGRWMSPDPCSGSYNIFDPQSFNRYAYVLDNPLSLVDPDGLVERPAVSDSTTVFANEGSWMIGGITGFFGFGYVGPGYCCGVGGHGAKSSVNAPRTPKILNKPPYTKTMSCSSSASQVMSDVERNFARYGNYSRYFGAESVLFAPPAGVGVGSTIPITVGILGFNQSLSVNVATLNSNSMTFTTNPGHLIYPGSITFAASPAGAGAINFSISISGTVANSAQFNFGGSAFEDAQWDHFLEQVGSFCGVHQ